MDILLGSLDASSILGRTLGVFIQITQVSRKAWGDNEVFNWSSIYLEATPTDEYLLKKAPYYRVLYGSTRFRSHLSLVPGNIRLSSSGNGEGLTNDLSERIVLRSRLQRLLPRQISLGNN